MRLQSSKDCQGNMTSRVPAHGVDPPVLRPLEIALAAPQRGEAREAGVHGTARVLHGELGLVPPSLPQGEELDRGDVGREVHGRGVRPGVERPRVRALPRELDRAAPERELAGSPRRRGGQQPREVAEVRRPQEPRAGRAVAPDLELALLQGAEGQGVPDELRPVERVPLVQGVEGVVDAARGPEAPHGPRLEQVEPRRGVLAHVVAERLLLQVPAGDDQRPGRAAAAPAVARLREAYLHGGHGGVLRREQPARDALVRRLPIVVHARVGVALRVLVEVLHEQKKPVIPVHRQPRRAARQVVGHDLPAVPDEVDRRVPVAGAALHAVPRDGSQQHEVVRRGLQQPGQERRVGGAAHPGVDLDRAPAHRGLADVAARARARGPEQRQPLVAHQVEHHY
mmetsp:Transcript_62353/g.175835  ORF Transcript_62353/g.175835 Transcript_62353/m.175835 type:complete len:397 (+) Transcript_62353:95-1285(+)